MLHGGPGLANSYLAYYQQPYLDFCSTVYYDQRGSGKTQIKNQTGAEELSLETMLDDLRQTIIYVKDRYDTDRVFLVGHSWGSMLGTQYILNYPNDVAGYIGYGQGIPGNAQDRHYYEFIKSEVTKSKNQEHIDALKQVNENFPNIPRESYFEQYNIIAGIGFGGSYDFLVNDPFEIYANSPTWTKDDEYISGKTEEINEILYTSVLYDWEVSTTEYNVPVYYVLGRYDQMTSSVIAAEYFETIKAPKKALYWIENAGHLVDTDKPKDFFKAIKKIVTNNN